MRNFYKFLFLSAALAACQTQEPAGVEYHLDDYYGYKTNKPEDVVNPSTQIEDVSQDYQDPVSSDVQIEDISKDFSPNDVNNGEGTYGPVKPDNSNDSAIPNDVIYVPMQGKAAQQPQKEEKINIVKPSAEEEKPQERPTSRTETISVSGKTHIVQKGDTLYSISRQYDIPILPIIIANKLSEPYNLDKGRSIIIPEAKFHVVGEKDTLYSISRQYSVDMTELAKTNNLSEPYSIYKGQKLQIPFANYSKESEPQTASNTTEPEDRLSVPDLPKVANGDKVLVSEKLPNENIKFTSLSNKKSSKGFLWPVNGKVIKNFGGTGNNYNDGINIAGSVGESVKATKAGKVVFTGDSLKSFGNLVIVKHDDGLLSAYAHLSKISVKKDQRINQGDEVGKVGNTGKVDSPQLYFAVRKGKQSMNPMNYLR